MVFLLLFVSPSTRRLFIFDEFLVEFWKIIDYKAVHFTDELFRFTCQNVQPLKNQVLQVTRRLDWTGTFYRYEMDIKVAKGLPSGGGTSDVGWW